MALNWRYPGVLPAQFGAGRDKTEKTRELSGGLCATVLYKGPYSNLTSVYAKLIQWIETEGYKITDAPYEIYLTNPGTTAPENYMTEIYFPVAKK